MLKRVAAKPGRVALFCTQLPPVWAKSPTVIALCRRILGDHLEAQDVAQDAFTQAYQSLATFRADGPFGAWLRRIAIRVAIARLASRREVSRIDADLVDIVALNAGAAIYVSGLAESHEQGVRKALAVISSGAARRKVDEVVLFLDPESERWLFHAGGAPLPSARLGSQRRRLEIRCRRHHFAHAT